MLVKLNYASLEDINAVEIKLNGRINPETILLKAVR